MGPPPPPPPPPPQGTKPQGTIPQAPPPPTKKEGNAVVGEGKKQPPRPSGEGAAAKSENKPQADPDAMRAEMKDKIARRARILEAAEKEEADKKAAAEKRAREEAEKAAHSPEAIAAAKAEEERFAALPQAAKDLERLSEEQQLTKIKTLKDKITRKKQAMENKITSNLKADPEADDPLKWAHRLTAFEWFTLDYIDEENMKVKKRQDCTQIRRLLLYRAEAYHIMTVIHKLGAASDQSQLQELEAAMKLQDHITKNEYTYTQDELDKYVSEMEDRMVVRMKNQLNPTAHVKSIEKHMERFAAARGESKDDDSAWDSEAQFLFSQLYL